MKFEGTTVTGVENAFIGMRLPYAKNYEDAKSACSDRDKDKALGVILVNADSGAKASGHGQPNSKFLRMIHCQVAITAPIYWWKEADTYKVGTTSNSTSTMHRLANYPITKECFEMDDYSNMPCFQDSDEYGTTDIWNQTIKVCETLRQKYNETKDKKYWKELIRLLPESWLQTRMLDLDYQTLRNIYYWRKNHKLTEWHSFCKWVETLPYAKEFIIGSPE